MPRWGWFVPLGLTTLVGALLAFRYGWVAATLTETDVINAFAQRYVTREGGAGAEISDCVGRAGQIDGAWITVQCNDVRYHVSRLGTLMSVDASSRDPSI